MHSARSVGGNCQESPILIAPSRQSLSPLLRQLWISPSAETLVLATGDGRSEASGGEPVVWVWNKPAIGKLRSAEYWHDEQRE